MNIKQSIDIPLEISFNSKVGKCIQNIECESMPFACFHCKKVRHWARDCPRKPPMNFFWKNKSSESILSRDNLHNALTNWSKMLLTQEGPSVEMIGNGDM